MLRLPKTRRAYVRSGVAGLAGFFALYIIAHQVLTRFGLRAESTYLDDALLGILVAVLVFALEAQHELEIRAERERAKVLVELNHHIRNALQTIVYVNSASAPSEDTARVTQATQRIDWALREIPRKAQTMPESNPNHHIDLRRRRPSS